MLDKYPNIKFILPHLGGAVPYLLGRWDIGWQAYPECRKNISQPPLTYLKQLYYDVVSLHVPALRCAYDTVGAGHMLLGTDYPHVIGNMRGVIESVNQLDIPADEKNDIFSANSLRVLNNVTLT